MANIFIEAINETLDTNVPLIDLAEVFAQDYATPDAMRARGLDIDQCLR